MPTIITNTLIYIYMNLFFSYDPSHILKSKRFTFNLIGGTGREREKFWWKNPFLVQKFEGARKINHRDKVHFLQLLPPIEALSLSFSKFLFFNIHKLILTYEETHSIFSSYFSLLEILMWKFVQTNPKYLSPKFLRLLFIDPDSIKISEHRQQ